MNKKELLKKLKEEPNIIALMCDELSDRIDELIDLVHTHNHKDDNKPLKLEDLDGKQIINTNPPHCHECCNDGTGCVKLILPGNQHICIK